MVRHPRSKVRRRARLFLVTVGVFGVLLASSPLRAQPQEAPPQGARGGFGPGFGPSGQAVVSVAAEFTAPGAERPGRLFVTATIQRGWHIYSITQPKGGPIATSIKLAPSSAYRLSGGFLAAQPPESKPEPLFGGLVVETHHGQITWYAPIELAPGVDPSTLAIEGTLRVQACDSSSCLPPQEYPFTARLGPGVEVPDRPHGPPAPGPAEALAASGRQAGLPSAGPPAEQSPGPQRPGEHGIPWVRVKTFDEVNKIVQGRIDLGALEQHVRQLESGNPSGGLSGRMWTLWLIVLGFAGGILLNVMPCVLPVIGLKILSFVNQAGEHRVRALMLNVAFSAGLISVFMILAALAAGLNLQWGGQFQYPWFNVTMAVVVFAMGISFLGVWEIPIPGFVGSGKAAEIAQREGPAGAFFTGIITTLLATPCTGPGMAFAVTMVMSEPPPVIFAVFLAVGLGMASPYLLIGVFPRLIGFLPKPGAWMDTFKQVMGFLLLATTVWILSFIHWPYLVPTVGLMFAAWAACWWVQRKAAAELMEKAWAWIEALAFVGLAWVLMFPGLGWVPGVYRIMHHRWQYATAGAQQATVAPGRYTLLVDFTADWCVNCKYVEANVLQTPRVRELIEREGVVPVQFDMTNAPEDAQTRQFVQALRVAQPSLAILPAAEPSRPAVVLRGVYTQGPVLEGLKKAGPSIDRPR